MTADRQMSGKETAACEALVREGDEIAARRYTIDALKHHSNSSDELHRRRMILARTDSPTVTPTECFGILSAMMGDRKGWDMALERLGASCDPGFGYLAWRTILYYSQDEDRAEDWFFAVKQAASLGHIPSKELVLKRKLRAARAFSGIPIRSQLFRLELERQKISKNDPDDRLLAEFNSASSNNW